MRSEGTCALETMRTPESRSAAEGAGLRYVSDCDPGILRLPGREGFEYRRADGRTPSGEDLARISALAVPPAWTDVWICSDPDGHLQATGRDKRGRKQYRYHPLWRRVRDGTKFERMALFGEALPRIRERVDADLSRRGLPREKLLALLVALLDRTLIRIGNPEYARANDSFGLSTLHDGNACIEGGRVRLRFRGKAGKVRVVGVDDPRLARAVRRARDLPGEELFQYVDERGETHVVGSGDVNAYLRDVGGEDVSSKDFRTWGGTLAVAAALAPCGTPPSRRAGEASVVEAVREAADILGNTPAICRKAYVHPGVVELFLEGRLADRWAAADVVAGKALRDDEQRLLSVLHALRES